MSDAALDPERIKAAFVAQRGYWRPWTETLLRENPGFVAQYARYAGYPARTGPLSERLVELIYVALDASASHLFEAGLRTHMARALAVGATPAEIFDVLHLVAAQGLACVAQAAEILAEETGAVASVAAHGTARASDALSQLDPAFAALVQDFIAQGGTGAGLGADEQCLVRVALHACFTAYNPPALREQIRAGLALGLTPPQMLQAIQLGAHLSVHGTALGAQVYAGLGTISQENVIKKETHDV